MIFLSRDFKSLVSTCFTTVAYLTYFYIILYFFNFVKRFFKFFFLISTFSCEKSRGQRGHAPFCRFITYLKSLNAIAVTIGQVAFAFPCLIFLLYHIFVDLSRGFSMFFESFKNFVSVFPCSYLGICSTIFECFSLLASYILYHITCRMSNFFIYFKNNNDLL